MNRNCEITQNDCKVKRGTKKQSLGVESRPI